MSIRRTFFALATFALLAPVVNAQPGRVGAPPPAPLFLPPPVVQPQGLGSMSSPITPRPLGYHVAPYGGLGYGPLGDRTGYPGTIYNTYRGSYLMIPTVPQLRLETPSNMPLKPGKLPALDVLFPAAPPMAEPAVPRMLEPVPPGPVVPVGEKGK
ncbi:unnamed protein product [Gemmata massiliana]|uniref:Uncharacterized protein n=1 Tax=Gemmata massiliana TaxID=1210884 RepID=A0A6P2D2I1_9BACT|nr:hypothetical protein [Gemmata massiliana]VTR95313.1 unnamed protein product [Gemmata massiliana]